MHIYMLDHNRMSHKVGSTDHEQEDFVVLVVLGRGSTGAVDVDEGGGPP